MCAALVEVSVCVQMKFVTGRGHAYVHTSIKDTVSEMESTGLIGCEGSHGDKKR